MTTTRYRGGLCNVYAHSPSSFPIRDIYELEPFQTERDEEKGESPQRIPLYDSHDISVSGCVHRCVGIQLSTNAR
jgi:hypothetical protein